MSDSTTAATPSRARTILYVIVIFVAGAVFGSALTIAVGRQRLERARSVETWNVEALRRLGDRLELTPEQRERIQPILADMTARLRETRIASRRAWISVLQDTRQRLRTELTPEQRAEFDKMAARRRDQLGRLLGAPPEPGRAGKPPAPPRDRE